VRAARPVLDGLESRELLSAVKVPHAEVVALRATPRHSVPTIAQLPTAPTRTASTVPDNGDVNPYGVAFVPRGFPTGGVLQPGDVLVSNFNNSDNLQGTGTTIVRVTPSGQTSTFYQGPPGVGLSTALGVLRRGFVIVGSVPSTDGTSATAMAGSLLVLDRNGHVVANFANTTLLNGPWDLTVNDQGNRAQIFVSNVLSGTVVRFDVRLPATGGFQVVGATQIASGFTHRGDPAAFELGPTGLAFDPASNVLYIASTADNVVVAIHNAGTTRVDHGVGRVIYFDPTHLHGPLGLTFASDGNLIVANGDAVNPDPNNTSTLVEFTRHGRFVGQFSLSTTAGGAFGVTTSPDGTQFAAVNDITNEVQVWQVRR
jgi:hypothetical protein